MPPAVGVRDGGPPAPACAEALVRSQASPSVAVLGAFACIDPTAQVPQGITDDEGLARYAATESVYTHYASCGQASGYWYFDLNSPKDGQHTGVRVQVDPGTGLVLDLRFSQFTHPSSACP
jgi:hypothetical protein